MRTTPISNKTGPMPTVSPNAKETKKLKSLINDKSASLNEIMECVRKKADVNIKNDEGNSLLHILSSDVNNRNGRNDKTIEELVNEYHADLTSKNDDDLTPLENVISGEFTTGAAMKLVRLSVKSLGDKFNINAIKNDEGNSLLHILSRDENNSDGRNDEAIEELVNVYHADLTSKNDDGLTPLEDLISSDGFTTEAAMKLVRLSAQSLGDKFNINAIKNDEGDSLLHILSSDENNSDGRNDKAIEELVNEYHADLTIKNTAGLTPLENLISGEFSTEEAMKLVRLSAQSLRNKFNINAIKSENGNSLLHILSLHGNNSDGRNDKAIEELVNEYHADLTIKNTAGLTPLENLISGEFTTGAAMKLVRLSVKSLGNKFDINAIKSKYGNSLLTRLSKKKENKNAIAELEGLAKKYSQEVKPASLSQSFMPESKKKEQKKYFDQTLIKELYKLKTSIGGPSERQLRQIESLIQQGARLDFIDSKSGKSALQIATDIAVSSKFSDCWPLVEKMLDAAIKRSTSLESLKSEVKEEIAAYVLRSAVLNKRYKVIESMLANRMVTGIFPSYLYDAVKSNNFKMVRVLLANGVDPDMVDTKTGNTALHVAVKANRPEMIDLLRSFGANVDIKNKSNLTPRELAGKNLFGKKYTDSLLSKVTHIQPSVSVDPSHKQQKAAANQGHVASLQQKGPTAPVSPLPVLPSANDQQQSAVPSPLPVVPKFAGFHNQLPPPNSHGREIKPTPSATLLFYAIKQKNYQQVWQVIEKRKVDALKANALNARALSEAVNVRDSEGNTPLHIAVEKNDPKMVSLLLELGANKKLANKKGQTAEKIAIKLAHNNPAYQKCAKAFGYSVKDEEYLSKLSTYLCDPTLWQQSPVQNQAVPPTSSALPDIQQRSNHPVEVSCPPLSAEPKNHMPATPSMPQEPIHSIVLASPVFTPTIDVSAPTSMPLPPNTAKGQTSSSVPVGSSVLPEVPQQRVLHQPQAGSRLSSHEKIYLFLVSVQDKLSKWTILLKDFQNLKKILKPSLLNLTEEEVRNIFIEVVSELQVLRENQKKQQNRTQYGIVGAVTEWLNLANATGCMGLVSTLSDPDLRDLPNVPLTPPVLASGMVVTTGNASYYSSVLGLTFPAVPSAPAKPGYNPIQENKSDGPTPAK